MNINDFNKYIITPKQRRCFPTAIKKEYGYVENGSHLLNIDSCSAKLVYSLDGEKPKIILDLGPAAPGGYPVFKIKSFKGNPVLRIAYSDIYDYIVEEKYAEFGDFRRGCCKYLGVELPVLPANPNRFELYTINRTGIFSYPLIQGQQRFVLITLDTMDTEIEIESFYIYYTSDMSAYDGGFECSSDDLNRLWYSSTYTVQIASIDNAQAWEVVEGRLAVRALTKGNDAGVYKNGFGWTDYSLEFYAQISQNPHCSSGIGWLLRAGDNNSGYVFRLDLDGTFHRFIREGGVNKEVSPFIKLDIEIIDNTNYHIKTEATGKIFRTYLNGQLIDQFLDSQFISGTIGFCQTTEKWAFVENLKVLDKDKVIFEDNFDKGLEHWDFTRSLSFVADGAKRDRLPWTGDLDWAGRNAYYAFNDYHYMPNSLKIFAGRQTPEGYIWGTCYPEDTDEILKGEFGYYQSDIFSAWFIPTLADYLLFSADTEAATEMYQNVVSNLNYLWGYVEADGLFFQRYATSKGLWDHVLNDIGKLSYNNIIIHDAFAEGAFIAENLGKNEDAAEFKRRADIMFSAIHSKLWNEEKGYFQKGLDDTGFCDMANSLAIALGFVTKENAFKIIENMHKWYEKDISMGKIVSLFIRGCYHYGFDELAIKTLTGATGFYNGTEGVCWIKGISDENRPSTTTECMIYVKDNIGNGGAWGDLSHPDTGMAHILSGYILGIQPTNIGYETFEINPHCCGLEYAKGIVPTPFGNIECEWKNDGDKLFLDLKCPTETTPVLAVSETYKNNADIYINGKKYF